jgi:hypothetical protein
MSFWWFPALAALAFSSAPGRHCEMDAGCVLVKETYCGQLSAIALGQGKEWSDWEAKLRAKDEKAGRKCPSGPRPDPRHFAARCESGLCTVAEKHMQ